MAPITDIVDLGQLGLKSGGGIRFDARVPVGPFTFGDQRYQLSDDPVDVNVDISRTSSGYVIRVRMADTLEGPCMRCYADYAMPLEIDHSEVHEPGLDAELACDYVSGQELDLAQLVRDAISLSLPTSISSPVDANGVCTECPGSAAQLSNMHGEPETNDAQPDPRWAKLRELEF